MLATIKGFLGERGDTPDDADPLVLACAALMYEVVRADASIDSSELGRLRVLMRRHFDLSTQELQALEARLAKDAEEGAVDAERFSDVVRNQWSEAQRLALVEQLWIIAWADGSVDGLEAQTVRRIGALLDVPDAAIGEARKRAGRAPRAPRD